MHGPPDVVDLTPAPSRPRPALDHALLGGAAGLYFLSMALPTVEGWVPGVLVLVGAVTSLPDAWPCAFGCAANVFMIGGLGLALGARRVPAARPSMLPALAGALAAACAVVCAVAEPKLLVHLGWWAWCASFALLAAASGRGAALRWWTARGVGLPGGVARALALAIPVTLVATPALVHLAPLAPAGLLVPPAVAIVATALGCAAGVAFALWQRQRREERVLVLRRRLSASFEVVARERVASGATSLPRGARGGTLVERAVSSGAACRS